MPDPMGDPYCNSAVTYCFSCFLSQVVQTGSKNVELAIMKKGEPMRLLEADEIEEYTKMIEAEKEAEAEKKKAKKLAAQQEGASTST